MTPADMPMRPAAHAGPNVVIISAMSPFYRQRTRVATARALMQPDAGWDGVHPRTLQDACDILRILGSLADGALADAAQPHITAHRWRWEQQNRFRWYHALVLGGFIAVMFFTLTVLSGFNGFILCF
jgi:hypothetical protein